MPHPGQPAYEDLAARNAELAAVVAEQAALIGALRAEVAALRRQAGRDSSNSSQPLSLDPPTILWGVFPVQFLPEEFSQANPGVAALPPAFARPVRDQDAGDWGRGGRGGPVVGA